MEKRNRIASQRILLDAVFDVDRLELLRVLSEGPSYISELAKKTGKDRAAITYHLSVLENAGVVESEYRILEEPHSKGKVGKFYKLNKKKIDEAFKLIRELMPIESPFP